MTATPPTEVLRGHVSAYAAAVRDHLSDLPPELVDDLTDGLEADLVDALEDPAGPVATGEVPLVRPGAGTHAGMIDLRARFGPAEEYAAELRAAAGLGPAVAGRRATVGDGVRGMRDRAAARLRSAARPLTSSPYWPAVEDVVAALTPVWWVLRGWVWFVVLTWVASAFYDAMFVPRGAGSLLVLVGLVLVSVQWSRGRLVPRHRVPLRLLRAGHVLAVVLVLPLVIAFWNVAESRPAHGQEVVYVDGGTQVVEPEAGVWVDGVRVSNLFVYDAEGNPVEGVQIFDDRGRQVRTVDDPWAEWHLPGMDEPWTFSPTQDVDGRDRWNVYPLRGAPWDEWVDDEDGERTATLRTPPWPFAKAPAVPGSVPDDVRDADAAADDAVDDPADDAVDDPADDGPAADDTAADAAGPATAPDTTAPDTTATNTAAPEAGTSP